MERRTRNARRTPREIRWLGTLTLLLAGPALGAAPQELTDDVSQNPAAAVFVYQDVENFIEAREALASGTDSTEAVQSRYLDRASPGLRMFIEKYDLTVERLLDAMKKHPDAYARPGESVKLLRAQEPAFREIYAELKATMPFAVFPPTYFVVGGYRGIGSGSIEGPLISIEKKTPESIAGDLKATLVHEMIHMQQLAAVGEAYFAIFSGEERTLLALSIREGAATFFADVIAGGSERKAAARDFYLARESDLWEAFRTDMLGQETGDWLWRKPSEPDQPRDLGYAIGARIVETFYDGSEDKREACREIMAITDYPAFLARSGYVERMSRSSSPK